jgi:hypothetical protein
MNLNFITRKNCSKAICVFYFSLMCGLTSCSGQKGNVVESYKAEMQKFNDSSVVVFDKAISDLKKNGNDHKTADRTMRTVLAFELQLSKKQEDFQKRANDAGLTIQKYGEVSREVFDKIMQPSIEKYQVLRLGTTQGYEK